MHSNYWIKSNKFSLPNSKPKKYSSRYPKFNSYWKSIWKNYIEKRQDSEEEKQAAKEKAIAEKAAKSKAERSKRKGEASKDGSRKEFAWTIDNQERQKRGIRQ
jgi:hypothetical protein